MGVPPLCRVVGGDLLRRREGGTTLPLAFDPWSLHSGSVLSLKPIAQAPPPHLHILHLPSIVPRRVNVTRSPVLPNSRTLRCQSPPPLQEVRKERRGHKCKFLVDEAARPPPVKSPRDEVLAVTRSPGWRKFAQTCPLQLWFGVLRRCVGPLKQHGSQHRWRRREGSPGVTVQVNPRLPPPMRGGRTDPPSKGAILWLLSLFVSPGLWAEVALCLRASAPPYVTGREV